MSKQENHKHFWITMMAKYQHGIVTYLDLLGFSSLIDATVSPDKILEILEVVKAAAREDTDTKKVVRIEYMCISDSIIRSLDIDNPTKVTAPELQNELLRLVHMQCELLCNGFAIRGGVSHGLIYFKGRTLFGPAYQRAYKLECDHAKYPRILVDQSIIDDFVGYPEAKGDITLNGAEQEVMDQIQKDSDGLWFVDYLRSFQNEVEDDFEFRDFLRIHQNFISKQLLASAHMKHVWEKYEWMRCYHNTFVSKLPDEWYKLCGVEREQLQISEIKLISH